MELGRIIEPSSKADTVRVLTDLGVPAPAKITFMRCLKRVVERNYRQVVPDVCYRHATQDGRLALVLYDVTTLYFEAAHEDGGGIHPRLQPVYDALTSGPRRRTGLYWFDLSTGVYLATPKGTSGPSGTGHRRAIVVDPPPGPGPREPWARKGLSTYPPQFGHVHQRRDRLP